MSFVTKIVDQFLTPASRRSGPPPLDGPWLPNEKLEEASATAGFPNGLEDMVCLPDGRRFVASGRRILDINAGSGAISETTLIFQQDICGLGTYDSDGLIVCLADAGIVFCGGSLDGVRVTVTSDGRPIRCARSVVAGSDGSIYIADASTVNPPDRWLYDLMQKTVAGRVVRFDPKTGKADSLLDGLAYPYGIALTPDGALVVTESWRHGLRRIDLGGGSPQSSTPLVNLPGYPARLQPARGGGYWLAIFALRTRLVEFVLTEDDYRNEMIATITPDYWVAPMYYSPEHYLEPLQQGGLKVLGQKKPWAPARSYGLVARLDAKFQVQRTWHSRVGRARHGIVTVCETSSGETIALSKGNALLLQIA